MFKDRQALKDLLDFRDKLELKVYPVPVEIDKHIAGLKLTSMGITIDKLTPEQDKYLNSWQEGT